MRNINTREAHPTTGTAFKLLWTVASTFENLTCSINEQPMNSKPCYGISLGVSPSRGLRSTCNVFINAVIEGVGGAGIRLTESDLNTFVGGTSEANETYGVITGIIWRNNLFKGMDFEGNGTADILDSGICTFLENCYTSKSIILTSNSKRAMITGGLHERLETQNGCTGAVFESLTINYFNTGNGGVYDNATGTAFRNVWDESSSGYVFPKRARTTISITASPFTYTNATGGYEYILINGGAVTQILFKRDTDQPITGVTYGFIMLAPGDQLVVSYSTPPSMSRIPMGENYT